MKYNVLGNTGLKVSELCLGAMTFGGRGFWTAIGSLDQQVADHWLLVLAKTIDATIALDQRDNRPWNVVVDDIVAFMVQVDTFTGNVCGNQHAQW